MPRVHLILALLTAGLLTALAAHHATAGPDAGVALDAAADLHDQAEEEAHILHAEDAYRARWRIAPPPPGVRLPVPVVLEHPAAGAERPLVEASPLHPDAEVEAMRKVAAGLIEAGIKATTAAVADSVKRAPESRRLMGALGVVTGALAGVGGIILGGELGLDAQQTAALSIGFVATDLMLFLFAVDDDQVQVAAPAPTGVANGQR